MNRIKQLWIMVRDFVRENTIFVSVTAALVAVALGLTGYSVVVGDSNDPGIKLCRSMHQGETNGGDTPAKKNLTSQERMQAYLVFREELKTSDYPEISAPGALFLDLAWQMAQARRQGEAGVESAYQLIKPLTEAYNQLSAGCATHDLPLPVMEPAQE